MIHQTEDSNQNVATKKSKSRKSTESTSTDSETKKPKPVKKKKKKTKIMDADTPLSSTVNMDMDDTDSTTRSVPLLSATSKVDQQVNTAGGRGSGSSTAGRGRGGGGRGRGGRGPPSASGGTVSRNSSMSSADDDSLSAPVKRPKSMFNISDSQSAPSGGGRGRGRGGRGPPSARGGTVARNSSMSSADDDNLSAPFKKPKSMFNISDSQSAPSGGGRGRGGRGPPSSRGGTIARNSSMSSADDNLSAPVKRPKSMFNINESQSAPTRPKSVKKINGRGAGVSNSQVNSGKHTMDIDSSHSAPLRPQSTNKLYGRGGYPQNGGGRGSAPKRNPTVRPPARPASMINMSGSLDPPPPSRRDSSPPKKPMPGSADPSNPKAPASYRAPSRPQSILRNSNHGGFSSGSNHGGSLHGGSNHGGSSHERKSIQSRISPNVTRVNPDGTVTVSTIPALSTHPQAIPEDADLHLDDMDPNFVEPYPRTVNMHPTVNMTPDMRDSYHTRSSNPSTRSPKNNSMDESSHSQTSRSIRQFSLSRYQSSRSIMTADREPQFLDDNRVQKALRYIRILPPHVDEKPIKRNIRIMTWVSLICDMLAAFVSIGTYDGTAHCCDVPILNIAGEFNWDLAIRITTYVYVALIFAEILPVVLDGIPFNLLNPFLGFLITFAVFFDDRILEAVVMWIIEATAVLLEVICYRLKLRQHKERDERHKQCEIELKPFSDTRRARKKTSQSTREMELNDSNDDDSSESGDSFGNDSFKDEEESQLEEPQDLSQVRELKLLRERRVLRQSQKEHAKILHYHMIGVAVNVSFVCIAFLLIVTIGRSGGLCILDMEAPNVFSTGQLEKCSDCKGIDGVCEICNDDGTSQCYYAYY
jgi:hypothetical protein